LLDIDRLGELCSVPSKDVALLIRSAARGYSCDTGTDLMELEDDAPIGDLSLAVVGYRLVCEVVEGSGCRALLEASELGRVLAGLFDREIQTPSTSMPRWIARIPNGTLVSASIPSL